jgi:hypothetical protein
MSRKACITYRKKRGDIVSPLGPSPFPLYGVLRALYMPQGEVYIIVDPNFLNEVYIKIEG